MITGNDSLKDLQLRAGKLASATESLAALFEEEGIRLKRGDQVARLKSLHATVMRHMEEVKHEERIAGYRYSEGKSERSIAGSFAGIVGEIFNRDWLRNMSQTLAEPPANGEPPFGTVLVRIGPGGVPEDVHVVSVSRLARESNRKESEVIEEIQKAKNQLLTEDDFTGFMAWLAEKILEGRLGLPFKPRPSLQIQASHRLRLGQQNKG